MLKELNVDDKIFLYDCAVKGDAIEYNLYEADENWTSVKTQEEVTQTLQLLNKRIKYNVETAFDTLQNAQPETANWEVAAVHQPSAALDRVLKLKYRVKGCPFNFEWHLRKQDNSLAIQLPINQVASLVESLPAQIDELLDVLRRKEDEIRQYKIEFGSLRRSTLATKPFNVDTFRQQYAATSIKVKSLQKIVMRWRAEHADVEGEAIGSVEQPPSQNSSLKTAVKKEEPETSSPSTHKDVQNSPRNRKRKALQAHKSKLTRTLQTRKPKLIYESQSQSLSDNEQQQDSKEVVGEVANTIIADEVAAELSENEDDARKSKIPKVSNNEEPKMHAAVPAREVKKNLEISKGQKVLENQANEATSTSTKATKSPVNNETKEVSKETATKSKKLSPQLGVRPNTRQRRRECATPDNNSNELLLIENPSENVVYTVDEATEPLFTVSELTSVRSTASKQDESKKCTTPTLNIVKMEQRRDDISLYVDSVLSQLDAFDKELKSQW